MWLAGFTHYDTIIGCQIITIATLKKDMATWFGYTGPGEYEITILIV